MNQNFSYCAHTLVEGAIVVGESFILEKVQDTLGDLYVRALNFAW